MATIASTLPTLADLARNMAPDQSEAKVIEILSQNNVAFEDMPFVEGNLPTGHEVTLRTALPSPTWRRINEGVASTKSTENQFVESAGMLDAVSKIDVKLVERLGGAAYRASQDRAHIAGIANAAETAIFYSSTKTDPEKIMGFAPRLDSTTGLWGGQIVDSQIAAGGSDQSSVFMVGWGEDKVFGFYPKGTKAGITADDRGIETVLDANSNSYRAYVKYFSFEFGICVADARYLVRLANVDTSAIAETGALFVQDMMKMVGQFHRTDNCNPVIYMNRKLHTYLMLQTLNGTLNGQASWDNVGGKKILHFQGIPIRLSDAIVNTEAIVT